MFSDLHEIAETFERLAGQTTGLTHQGGFGICHDPEKKREYFKEYLSRPHVKKRVRATKRAWYDEQKSQQSPRPCKTAEQRAAERRERQRAWAKSPQGRALKAAAQARWRSTPKGHEAQKAQRARWVRSEHGKKTRAETQRAWSKTPKGRAAKQRYIEKRREKKAQVALATNQEPK